MGKLSRLLDNNANCLFVFKNCLMAETSKLSRQWNKNELWSLTEK